MGISVRPARQKKMLESIDMDERGVSPVVGVILMVAITVVMASIVSSWSSSVKAPTSPTTVGMDISRSGTNITITVTSIDPPSSAPIPSLGFTLYNVTGENVIIGGAYTNSSSMTNADVGNMMVINANSTTIRRLIATATYKDGSKKVLYSQET